jgi:hypothetical protein
LIEPGIFAYQRLKPSRRQSRRYELREHLNGFRLRVFQPRCSSLPISARRVYRPQMPRRESALRRADVLPVISSFRCSVRSCQIRHPFDQIARRNDLNPEMLAYLILSPHPRMNMTQVIMTLVVVQSN